MPDDDLRLRRSNGERDRNAVWAVHERAFRAAPIAFDPELDRHLRHPRRTFVAADGDFLVGTLPVPPASPDPDGRGSDDERVVAVGGYLPTTADASSVRPASPVDPAPDTAEVRSVRVDPDFQRRGYGRRLVETLEDRAREAGFERAVLDTNVALTGAQALYESLGYQPVGREPFGDVELVYYERPL